MATQKSDQTLRTTEKQPGGVTGKGFMPGRSGNPKGRPKNERCLLVDRYGEDGATLYAQIEAIIADADTPAKLRADLVCFIIERLHGRTPQTVIAPVAELTQIRHVYSTVCPNCGTTAPK